MKRLTLMSAACSASMCFASAGDACDDLEAALGRALLAALGHERDDVGHDRDRDARSSRRSPPSRG